MSIFDWLRKAVAGEAAAPLQFTESEQHFHGLDMKAAIEAHLAWKARLEAQIRGDAGETLEVGVVAADCNCALGKWIHGEAQARFSGNPEFDQLKSAHADFHLCAGSILSDAHEGNAQKAETELKVKLRRHSDAVQLSLVRLYAKASAAS